jgi:hypothetical protein
MEQTWFLAAPVVEWRRALQNLKHPPAGANGGNDGT